MTTLLNYAYQRLHERVPLALHFKVRANPSQQLYDAVSRDITPFGAQIETNAPCIPDTYIALMLSDPGMTDTFVNAEIRWVIPVDATRNRCGVAFRQKNDLHIPLTTLSSSLLAVENKGNHAPSDFILDSISDGVFSVDNEWRITSFNKAAENLTGWSRLAAIGKKCREVFMSNSCEDNCVLAESIRNKQAVHNKSVFITHINGKRIGATISATPLFDDAGKIKGGVQMFRDVNAITYSSLILDNIADGVFTVDKEWRITSFNSAAEKITGFDAEEAIGQYCSDVFHSSICGKTCAIAHSMCTGKPEVSRCIHIEDSAQKRIPVSICAAPMYDMHGNLIGGVETFRDLRVVLALQQHLFQRNSMGNILSKNPAMRKIFEILPPIARSGSNVLILGESGTGKELVARAIHHESDRSRGPFVAVNCGALPDTLLEAELFGCKAGAYTDAKKDREGRFAAAANGTILLDEIGDISPAMQVKLLRVLQEKCYEPLGSNVSVPANARVLAATNCDLEGHVKDGTFRDDLYYRLNVVKLHLPPLRERIEDVPLLADHFVEKLDIEKERDISGISDAALRRLMAYDYPGNIRELQNIIEYSFILCPGGLIQPEHLPSPFNQEADQAGNSLEFLHPMPLAEIEKMAISCALKRNQWKRMATCKELGVSKDTLRRKIQQYGLDELADLLGQEQLGNLAS